VKNKTPKDVKEKKTKEKKEKKKETEKDVEKTKEKEEKKFQSTKSEIMVVDVNEKERGKKLVTSSSTSTNNRITDRSTSGTSDEDEQLHELRVRIHQDKLRMKKTIKSLSDQPRDSKLSKLTL